MIDRLKINVLTSLPLNPLPKDVTPEKFVNDRNDYYLKNKFGDHELSIKLNGTSFIMDGSIRKYFLGADSFDDLTVDDFYLACEEIAMKLSIDVKYILHAKIYIVEFGMTFRMPLNCSAILNRINRYSTFKMTTIENNYKRFNPKRRKGRGRGGFEIAMYDKYQDVMNSTNKAKFADEAASNLLRIEMRCSQFSVIRAKMKGAENVADIFKNYRMIIVSFLNELKRIELQPLLLGVDDVSFEGKTPKDVTKYAMSIGLEYIGLPTFKAYLMQTDITSGNLSNKMKGLKATLKGFSIKGEFDKACFMREVKKPLAKQISRTPPFILL